jgi:hypothetical protein
VGSVRRGADRRARERVSEPGELGDGRSRRREVLVSERDLDLGGEQSRPGKVVPPCLRERSADRVPGAGRVASGQEEKGGAGLRRRGVLGGLRKGVGGAVEVAHPEVDLADLREGLAYVGQLNRLHSRAGVAGTSLGLGPCAAADEDGDAVGLAVAREAVDSRPDGAFGDCVHPLRGSSVVSQLVACADRSAEDHLGRKR